MSSTGPVGRYKKRRFDKAAQIPCRYCGRVLVRSTATVDHKWPRSRGGSNAVTNLTIACFDCNNDKGSMTFDEFKASSKLPARCRFYLRVHPKEGGSHAALCAAVRRTWSEVIDEVDPDRERWKA